MKSKCCNSYVKKDSVDHTCLKCGKTLSAGMVRESKDGENCDHPDCDGFYKEGLCDVCHLIPIAMIPTYPELVELLRDAKMREDKAVTDLKNFQIAYRSREEANESLAKQLRVSEGQRLGLLESLESERRKNDKNVARIENSLDLLMRMMEKHADD